MPTNNAIIVIPAYNPQENILPLIEKIRQYNYQKIIIVNDGSTESSKIIFQKLDNFEKVIVLHHAINLGKGAALKTAFNYILLNYPKAIGVITADADGQHLPKDIKIVLEELLNNNQSFVLGVRSFSNDIPKRSYLGNCLTKYIFGLLVGKMISDTQTGLRGIPMNFVKKLLKITPNRYEYELEMLIIACQSPELMIKEIPIETVYINDNKSSHFNPLLDSFKIYFVFIRFIASSLFASITDFIVFALLIYITSKLLLSMVIARIISLALNFVLNKKLVFHTQHKKTKTEIIKFSILAVFLFFSSYFSIEALVTYCSLNYYIAKILAEGCLFLLSFSVQKTLIFNNHGKYPYANKIQKREI